MQVCPNCHHRNRLGVVFCENCGASLIGNSPMRTKTLGNGAAPEAEAIESAAASIISSVGSDIFAEGSLLKIDIEGGSEPILLKPRQETILGRRDPATGAMPDVDLTPFAGYRMGVSRRHAAIRPAEGDRLDVWDLGSSNGTFLNGTRLGAHRPYKLRDGDEIRLGQMVMKITFQPPAAKPVTPPAPSVPTIPPSTPPGTSSV